MSRLDNIFIKPILEYGEQYPTDILLLAEWANLCWENQPSDEWVDKNKTLVERAERARIMECIDGELKCVNDLFFEYLYAVHFSKTVLQRFDNKWDEIYKAAWHKRHREKSKQGYALHTDFLSLVIIAMSREHGIEIIDTWIADMDIHFGKHFVSLENVLLHTLPTVEQLVKLGTAIELKNNHSLNKFAQAIRIIIGKMPGMAEKLESAFRSSDSDYLLRLVPWIALGLADAGGTASLTSRLTRQLESTSEEKMEALGILGMTPMDQENWDCCGKEISEALQKLFETENIEVHAKALNAFRNLYPYAEDFGHYVKMLSTRPEKEIRMAVIEALWLTADKSCTEKWFEEAFLNADHVDASQAGLIDELTYILYPVVEKNPSLFAEYLNRWILNESNAVTTIRFFDDVITNFFTSYPDDASKWLTLSFMNPNERFHQSLLHVISELWIDGFKFLTLHKPTLDASEPVMIRYVLFKICGYIYSKEPLESLAYSLLARTPFRDDITVMIGDAFIQHITYEYGGTNAYLREQLPTANEAQSDMIKRVLEFNDQYNDSVQKIRKIKELKLSVNTDVNFKQAKMKRLSENMQVGKDERKRNSIMDYVKKVSIKGGRAFFSKHDYQYHPPAKMGHFESSFEMPMGEAIDMVRDKLKMLHWKQFKFPE